MTYLVTWNIHIEADNPEEAARKALAIQRNPESIATVFRVLEAPFTLPTQSATTVDLTLLDQEKEV